MSDLQQGIVQSVHKWSDGLVSLRVTPTVPLQFIPGQYARIGLEAADTPVVRPYSIASSPESPELEVMVVEVADGQLSPRLCQLKRGQRLLVATSAAGFLVLEETPKVADMWLLATGTGIAPFVSMLREGSIFDRHQRVILVHGARYRRDLICAEELAQLARRQDGFCYVQVISRESPHRGDTTTAVALSGRITSTLEDGSLERAAATALGPAHSHLMLCGNPQMIDETTQLLQKRSMQKHRRRRPGQITVEKYW